MKTLLACALALTATSARAEEIGASSPEQD